MNFPSTVDTSIIQSVIQREFRDDISSVSKSFDYSTRRQVAFTALRELNKKISFFEMAKRVTPKYIPQQAALHVSPLLPSSSSSSTTTTTTATPITATKSSSSTSTKKYSYLKPGTFLISHPKMMDSFFSKSVICILDRKNNNNNKNNNQSSQQQQQTYGIIVNRLSINGETGKNRTLKEAFDDNMLPERLADTFGDKEVKRGGPVHVALQMLYSLPGSTKNTIGGNRIPPMIPPPSSPHHNVSSRDKKSTTTTTPASTSPDRTTYFQGDVFKAITAVEKGILDRGTY